MVPDLQGNLVAVGFAVTSVLVVIFILVPPGIVSCRLTGALLKVVTVAISDSEDVLTVPGDRYDSSITRTRWVRIRLQPLVLHDFQLHNLNPHISYQLMEKVFVLASP